MKKKTCLHVQSFISLRRDILRYNSLLQVIFLVAIYFNSKVLFSKPLNELKNKLDLIQKHLNIYEETNNSELSTNPLTHVSFSQFKSSNYLYLYRGIAYALITLNKKNTHSPAKNMIFLKKALKDIKESFWMNRLYEKKARMWLETIYKHLILITFSNKQYFQTLSYIEKQTLDHHTNKHYDLYAAYSFFETKQFTRLKRLLHSNPLFFKKSLNTYPLSEADNTLKTLIINTTVSVKAHFEHKKKRNTFPLNKQDIYTQIHTIFDELNYRYYSDDFARYFDRILSVYIKALSSRSTTISSDINRFIEYFEINTSKLPPTILIKLIKRLWQHNHHKHALHVSKVFIKEFRYHPSFLEVLYDKARLLEELKEYHESLLVYDNVIRQSLDTKYHEKATYRKALILTITKSMQAKKAYDDYLNNFPNGENTTTISYFNLIHHIELEKETNKDYKNSSILQKKISSFIKKNPLSFYAILLGKNWSHLYHKHFSETFFNTSKNLSKILKKNQFFSLSIKEQTTLALCQELLDLGLKKDAKALLDTIPFDKENMVLSLYLLKQYKELDDLPKTVIHSMLSYRYFPTLTKHITIKDIFPEYKKETILSLLKTHDLTISPHFIMSLIRQESAFDPLAVSRANAMGVMQIIPSTAKMISKKMNVPNYNMHHTEDNLNFGMYYLSTLLFEFDNNIIFALSSYNAGKRVAKRWQQTMGDLEPLYLIESIPYQETRQYVKFIIRNFAIYQLLYENKNIAYVHTHTNQPTF